MPVCPRNIIDCKYSINNKRLYLHPHAKTASKFPDLSFFVIDSLAQTDEMAYPFFSFNLFFSPSASRISDATGGHPWMNIPIAFIFEVQFPMKIVPFGQAFKYLPIPT